jgi:hypothetical protein
LLKVRLPFPSLLTTIHIICTRRAIGLFPTHALAIATGDDNDIRR